MSKFLSIIIFLLKNVTVFLGSGILVSLVIFLVSKKSLMEVVDNGEASIGVLALIPVLMVYFILFGIVGGVVGVIVYNLIKFFKRRKAQKVL